MAQIPEKVANFAVYGGVKSVEFIGAADAELPSFDAITEKITGAGIAGEVDSAVAGHFASQSVKVKFRVATAQVLKMPVGIYHIIDLRGAIQIQDASAGSIITQSLRIEVRGLLKSLKPGKFEVGKVMDAEIEVECSKITVYVDNKPVVELDKLNYVYKVDGVDYLKDVRLALGQS